jgi:restriction system protein
MPFLFKEILKSEQILKFTKYKYKSNILAIPTYEDRLFPLLKFSSDSQEHSVRDPIDYTAKRFNLSEEEKNRLEPSKKRTLLYIRIAWALTYLKQAGLMSSTKRGFFRITDRGIGVLKQNPKEIDVKYLQKFQEFTDFQNRSRKGDEDSISDLKPIEKDELTPEEKMEEGFNMIQEKLKDELLTTIKKSSSVFF